MSNFVNKDGNIILNLNYSSEESFTGMYWIDSKKIYSITFKSTAKVVPGGQGNFNVGSLNIDTLIDYFKGAVCSDGIKTNQNMDVYVNSDVLVCYNSSSNTTSWNSHWVTLYYTKK